MNWLVTWTLVNIFTVSCPTPPITTDEYGRLTGGVVVTLQNCTDRLTWKKGKEFATYEEAKAFTKGCKKSYVGYGCEDFKIIDVSPKAKEKKQ